LSCRLGETKTIKTVFVSPQGTDYWSITKAYAVFQEQLQKSRGNSSKFNNIEVDASDAISNDDLAMLKKNIVKRRKKDNAEKNSGVDPYDANCVHLPIYHQKFLVKPTCPTCK
jgi:hypothetical protein